MGLTTGTRLGVYEVVAPIGAGGMGEVYRARDTRLGRDVAVKILPEAFAMDPERLARFEREARTLAALNHPNIATIHGLEESAGVHALVMELVEGDDLSTRLARGRLPVAEATPVARQIADALEAAHEAGITHRDLKPANVKVRADGTVKVLDFGLAKVLGPGGGVTASGGRTGSGHEGDGSRLREQDPSPSTMTSPAMTAMGMILGTAAYMSPEQARGRPVDRRADIWAFGCVLFEMLAGQRPFGGDDVSETLASVIKDEPAWNALPGDLPPSLRRLLRRCLTKDPKRRLSAMGDARLDLDDASAPDAAASAGAAAPGPWSARAVIAGVLALVGVAAAAFWLGGFGRTAPASLRRLTVLAPPGHTLFRDSANLALSPDGTQLAFLTGLTRADTRLWIRSVDSLDAREVDDSVGAQLPFWSPDSRSLAFFAGGKLKAVGLDGSRPRVIADAPDGRGGAWSSRGVIVFAASNAGPLSRVSENGGEVTAATTLLTDAGETGHRFPSFLPDGEHFVFAAVPARQTLFDIHVGSLGSTDRVKLLAAESAPVYADPGFLVYSRKGVLVAHPFDAGSRELGGEAIPLPDRPGEMNLEYSAGQAASAAHDGSVAYLSAAQARSRVVWLDQTGRETSEVDVPPGPYANVAIAPDGRRAVVVQVASPHASLWWMDVLRGGLTPLSQVQGWNSRPVFSPDSRRVAYTSDRRGPMDLYLRGAGSADDEPLYQSPTLFKYVASWSATGVVVFTDLDPATDNDLWAIRPDGDRKPELSVRSPGNDSFGAVSPDGRWMAYISNQAGAPDAYVQTFPASGQAHRLTTTGILEWALWWREDGRQLMMLDAKLGILLVDVRTSPEFSASEPRVVGRIRYPMTDANSIDVTPDFQRLLALVPEQENGGRSLTVVLNWSEALK